VEDEEAMISQEDIKFLNVLETETLQDTDNHYTLPLPFRDRPLLPNNRKGVMKRFTLLEKKFKSNPRFSRDYHAFMDDIIKNGDAEKVQNDERTIEGEQWYIPHFGIYHPKKPDKIRVVFDCSARYDGTSLNEHLLQGPDMMNSLIGILCRFRLEPIAIMGDIERMFHQFRVKRSDRDYLRFVWNDENKEIVVYHMNVQLFGAVSSPGCATFGLRQVAKDYQYISKTAAEFIIHDFYVDDGVTSVRTVEEAIKLIRDARAICSKGGIRLHKFVCNNREVLETIAESERGSQTQKFDFSADKLPVERTLGLQWCVETDTFGFQPEALQERPSTRRGMLSTVSQIYDPLGFIAPYVFGRKTHLTAHL
jgi:hypothetical protein